MNKFSQWVRQARIEKMIKERDKYIIQARVAMQMVTYCENRIKELSND